jgi:hypothetical protein
MHTVRSVLVDRYFQTGMPLLFKLVIHRQVSEERLSISAARARRLTPHNPPCRRVSNNARGLVLLVDFFFFFVQRQEE